jgi:hypothetical protein
MIRAVKAFISINQWRAIAALKRFSSRNFEQAKSMVSQESLTKFLNDNLHKETKSIMSRGLLLKQETLETASPAV